MNAEAVTTENVRPVEGDVAEPGDEGDGEKLGDTIRRVLYVIVTFSLVFFVTLLSPDETIVPANGALVFPYVETKVNVTGFIVFGPFVLLSLSIYLHSLYGRFLLLSNNAPRIYVFSMRSLSARIVSEFLFYWLVPSILCLFVWAMLPRPEEQHLVIVAAMSIAGFGTLRIVRLNGNRRPLVVVGAVGALVVAVGAVSIWVLSDSGQSTLLRWRSVDFSRATFEDKDMEAVDLRGASMEDAHFLNTTLRNSNLSESVLARARFEDTDLREADLSNIVAPSLILERSEMHSAKLSGASLRGAVMEDVDARTADMTGITLTGATLRQVDLSFAHLKDANLSDVTFEFVDLTSAKMHGATLLKANLRQATLYFAVLNDVRALKANFLSANLVNAQLQKANLQRADLTSADLSGANLTDAQLMGADLRLAKLTGADLSGADLEDADLRGARGLSCAMLTEAKNGCLALRDDALACQTCAASR